MHRKVAVAIVAALALVAASCGGTETTTLGRAELVRRVEVACREAQATAAREARAAGRTADPIAGLQAGQKALLDRLEGLEGSGAAKADFDAYKEGMRTRLALIDKVVSASRADRQRVLRSIQSEATAAGRKIEGAVRGLGLQGCS